MAVISMSYWARFCALFLIFFSVPGVNAYGDPNGYVNYLAPSCLYYAQSYDWGCPYDESCFCNTTALVLTVVNCIVKNTPEGMETVMYEQLQQDAAICEAAGVTLDIPALVAKVSDPSFESTMLNTTLYTKADGTPYDTPINLDHENLYTYALFFYYDARNWVVDYWFSFAPLIFLFGVLSLAAVYNLSTRFAPSFVSALYAMPFVRFLRKKVFLPAAGKYHHLTPKKLTRFGPSLVVPTRFQTLVIISYVLLNIIPPWTEIWVGPGNIAITKKGDEYGDWLGRRSGFMCLAQLIVLTLFAGRNNFCIWLTGWSLDTFNLLHKCAGVLAALHIIVHSAAYTGYLKNEGYLQEEYALPYFQWGIAGTILFCLMAGFSGRYFRSLKYEVFLIVHIIFAIFCIVCTWYHLAIGLPGYEFLYTTIALWGFDRAARLARIVWSGLRSNAEIELISADPNTIGGTSREVLKIRVHYSNRWKWHPGSYVFIHFIMPFGFWESHPFTPVPAIDDSGDIIIYADVRKGMTRRIAQRVAKSGSNKIKMNVCIDGPYGHSLPIQDRHDSLLLVSGGLGVTFTLAQALGTLRNTSSSISRIVFLWVTKSPEDVNRHSSEFRALSADKRVEMRFFFTAPADKLKAASDDLSSNSSVSEKQNESNDECKVAFDVAVHGTGDQTPASASSDLTYLSSFGRPNLSAIVADEIVNSKGSLAVAVCGPSTMNDDTRAAVVENIDKTTNRVDYFEEAFSW